MDPPSRKNPGSDPGILLTFDGGRGLESALSVG